MITAERNSCARSKNICAQQKCLGAQENRQKCLRGIFTHLDLHTQSHVHIAFQSSSSAFISLSNLLISMAHPVVTET